MFVYPCKLEWYHLPDVLRTECYEVIIQISRELRIAKEYLGIGLIAAPQPQS